MKRLLINTFLLFAAMLANAQADQYKFRRIDISDGLSNNQVTSFLHDSAGYIWMGTGSGLNRYDGYSFKTFKNVIGDTLSIANNEITQMFMDHEGKFWLMYHEGFNCIFDPITEKAYTDHPLFHKQVPINLQFITDMLVDKKGNLWISNSQTGLYHYDVDADKLTLLPTNPNNAKLMSSSHISDMSFDSDGDLWICNQAGVVEKIDIETFYVTSRIKVLNIAEIGETPNLSMFIDNDDDIWVYATNYMRGVYYYSCNAKIMRHFTSENQQYHITNNNVCCVEQDDFGMIWVGIDHGGINVIDKNNLKCFQLSHNVYDPISLSHNSVKALYKDNIGRIWVGTFKSGACSYHRNQYKFQFVKNIPNDPNSLPFNDINTFAEDKNGNIWLGTNGGGLIYLDRRTGKFTTYRSKSDDANGLSSNVIVSLCVDHDNNLWIGTYYGGLLKFDGKNFTCYRHDANDPRTISDDKVWCLLEDSEQRLWVGTLGGGLDVYDFKSDRFLHYRNGGINSVHSDYILSLAEDHEKNIWIGTSQGVDQYDYQSGRFVHYQNNSETANSLVGNVVMCIEPDSRGWIWFGTRDGISCFNPKNHTFNNITESDGLPTNIIQSLKEDDEGGMWFSTLNGIGNLQFADNPDFTNYKLYKFDIIDGLQGKEYNEHSGYRLRTGEILFGGANGFNIFNPALIQKISIKSNVVITDFRLFNRSVSVETGNAKKPILTKNITCTNKIRIPHSQNIFSIEFSSLNNLYSERTRYQYKLDGFNSNWVTVESNQRVASFTNLNAGNYTFRVKATDNNDEWCDDMAILEIEIVPPFYASRFAVFMYYIIVLVALMLFIRYIKKRERYKYEQRQERREHMRQHEVDEMKIRFLTNVSHEFRTPLTLILTPIEKMLNSDVSDEVSTYLKMIQRNGKRLYNLVNQLLDIQKIEAQSVTYNPSFGNIVEFTKMTTESFTDLSEAKKINFHFSSQLAELNTYFDHDKIEKILFNLLSNAFRYTPEGGNIEVTVSKIDKTEHQNPNFKDASYVEIRVSDTGIGIEKEAQEHIFERFFQSNKAGEPTNQGTGIGLAIASEFVKVHKGTIEVVSALGKGSTFIVSLPINSDYSAVAVPSNQKNEAVWQTKEADLLGEVFVDDGDSRSKVLIVEDNDDLRFYLRDNLSKEFVVIEARNGEEALERIENVMPDIIVSDIMMPVMDGLALCDEVKRNAETSHIPIILLTAMTTTDQTKEGLERGADDYIAKPFNYDLLLIKIRKFIERKEQMHRAFNQKMEITPGEITVTSLDEKFMQKALKITEENMSNPDYSVKQLSLDLGVSRGHLYNKMIAITGHTPIEFIRIMRLKRAAQLLGKSQMSVSEVAYQVGFNDARYFARYFKDEFHLTPSEYAKKNAD